MAEKNFIQLTTITLFSALFTFGSMISLPLFAIPITAQSFFVLLAGLLLGSKAASLSVFLWLLLGALGLPLFSAGRGGIAFFLSPSGGYLLGYLLMAFAAGLARHLPIYSKSLVKRSYTRSIYLIPAMLSVYLIGLPWLRWRTGLVATGEEAEMLLMSWPRTLSIGLWPFLITDLIKAFLAATTYEALFNKKANK